MENRESPEPPGRGHQDVAAALQLPQLLHHGRAAVNHDRPDARLERELARLVVDLSVHVCVLRMCMCMCMYVYVCACMCLEGFFVNVDADCDLTTGKFLP